MEIVWNFVISVRIILKFSQNFLSKARLICFLTTIIKLFTDQSKASALSVGCNSFL